MSTLTCEIEVRNEGAHEPCLANACGKGKTKGWKLALEILDGGVKVTDGRKRSGAITALGHLDPADHVGKDLQRFRLRLAKRKALADGTGDSVGHFPSP